MSKGIAINTILLLLLGILVIGVVVYLLYNISSGTQLSEQNCRSRIITWCTGCSVSNWASGSGVVADTSDVGECIIDYFSTANFENSALDFPVNCDKSQTSAAGATQTYCSSFI